MSYNTEEIARRGEELYELKVRPNVEAGNLGRFLVLDVLSGRYEIAEDDLTATLRLLTLVPDAVTYGVRIGSQEAYHLGSVRSRERR